MVTLRKDFWIGETEVTQRAYQIVAGNNPESLQRGRPAVESVTWGRGTKILRDSGKTTADGG